MTKAFRDTRDLTVHPAWDADTLMRNSTSQSISFVAIVEELRTVLTAAARTVYSDPLYSGLVSYTNKETVSYRQGTSNGFTRYTEYGRPDPQIADTTGHMLPLVSHNRALGWTWDFLRQADEDQVVADILDSVKDAKDLYRQETLTRLFVRGDETGASIGLGSTGISPGFCTPTAVTNVPYTPPSLGGTTFTNQHEHYLAYDVSGVATAAQFVAMKEELREHGHEPSYICLVSHSDEAMIRAIDGFVPVDNTLVIYQAADNRTSLSGDADMNGGYFIGTIEDFAVRVVRGLPSGYMFGYKSYGSNSARNPLRVRVGLNAAPQPLFIAQPDPRSSNTHAYPLQYAMIFTEFGVGVGADRTNGVSVYLNGAAWTDGAVQ